MKLKSLLFLFLFLAASFLFNKPKAQAVNTGDSLALVDLYNSTNGPAWRRHQNWLTTKPVSKWIGVTVTGTRVTNLLLQINNLNGTLPLSLGNLTALTELNLQGNSLTGAVPSTIGNLAAVITLTFEGNGLTSLPSSIGGLNSITLLDISNNALSGSIPDSITQLTKLTLLYLNGNHLTGSIPAAIGNLVNLTDLELHDNNLSGRIPASLTNLSKLVTFDASFNKLSGSLPANIGNLDSVQTFYVGVNDLTGSIPTSIGKLSNLENLDFSSNQLTGSIPGSIGNLSRLQDIEFEYNKLSGSIPASLGNVSSLLILDLSNNQLSGVIPPSLGKLQLLGDLDIGFNQLTGSIPPSIIKLPVLNFLEAYYNQLTDGANLSNAQYSIPNLNLSIGYNRFTFNTLQYVAGNIPHASYIPQAPLGINQHGNKLAVNAGGTVSKNTYTWYRAADQSKDTTITGDSTFKPSAGGSYYATITNSVATAITLTTDTVTYTISPLIANEVPMKLSVYPNPARNSITINGITDPGLLHITITDVSGTIWSTFTLASQASVQANVGRLKTGNYTLHLTNGSQTASVNFMKE